MFDSAATVHIWVYKNWRSLLKITAAAEIWQKKEKQTKIILAKKIEFWSYEENVSPLNIYFTAVLFKVAFGGYVMSFVIHETAFIACCEIC